MGSVQFEDCDILSTCMWVTRTLPVTSRLEAFKFSQLPTHPSLSTIMIVVLKERKHTRCSTCLQLVSRRLSLHGVYTVDSDMLRGRCTLAFTSDKCGLASFSPGTERYFLCHRMRNYTTFCLTSLRLAARWNLLHLPVPNQAMALPKRK